MRRVYLKEALEARPIIKRLTGNLVENVVNASTLVKAPGDVTVIQLRQLLDEVEEDVDKLRNRLAAAERQLQTAE